MSVPSKTNEASSLSPKFKLTLSPNEISPVIVPPARGNLVAILFVTVVAKLGSSASAAASSLSVSRVVGAESVIPATMLVAVL